MEFIIGLCLMTLAITIFVVMAVGCDLDFMEKVEICFFESILMAMIFAASWLLSGGK